jgi:L-lysine exporter family protein LysE/ArgO
MLNVLAKGMMVGVALAAPIGPINIEIIRRGLSGGFVNGWLVGLGALAADTILCALVVSGVAPVADDARFRAPFYAAGAIVLIYLGVMGLRAVLTKGAADGPPPSGKRSFATGFLMAVSNPMGIVYWLSIGSALIASSIASDGAGAGPILIVGVFAGIAAWVTVLSGLTQAGRRFVSARVMLTISAIGAAILLAFGLYFGWLAVSAISSL